jgi:hypothetical protein
LNWAAEIDTLEAMRSAPNQKFLKTLSILVATFCYAAISCQAQSNLNLTWTNNLLTVSRPNLPGEKLEIYYLEAFCRKGSTQRDWRKTVLPHKTKLISAEPTHLRFRTSIEPDAVMLHEVRSGSDVIHFQFALTNESDQSLDLEWFQPACIRVNRFTGANQSNYIARSFIFTERGLTTLDKTRRREEAWYRGGQVYVPKVINLADVNPRPISDDQPVNGLIGCFSADGTQLLATASSSTHELFEGVYVCLHSDPHVGGLGPHEQKKIEARIYLMKNDPKELLKRYQRDFANSEFPAK